MRVVFSNRAFAAVLAETTEKITTETGGLFLGVVQGDSWYIIEAIDPGPKSVFEIAYFEYDQKYTQHLINKIANLYNCKLDLIGLWHRHPGSFDKFSSTDDGTNAKYASMRKEGAISGLVNIDPSFRLTLYHVDQPCRYQKIPYEVGNDLIPDEYLSLKSPDRFFDLMQRRLNPGANRETRKKTRSLEAYMRILSPVIADAKCEGDESCISIVDSNTPDKLTEAVIDDLTFMGDKVGIEFTAEIKGQSLVISQEEHDSITSVSFMESVKEKSIVFSYKGDTYLYHSGMFEEATKKALEEKESRAKAATSNISSPIKQPSNIVDAIKMVFKFYRNEGPNDGNQNS